MTRREEEILKLLRENPFINQEEIARILGITRSSVGVHIANLMKKGKIKGRGYILSADEPEVTVIGGANIDIYGFPYEKLRLQDSNPGKVKINVGGVARNIAENLARLGVATRLITAIGDDFYGKYISERCREAGVNTEEILTVSGESSSVYLAVMDETGDMAVAVAGMDILNHLDLDFLKKKLSIINSSPVCVVDTNLPVKSLEFLINNAPKTEFFLDGVSVTKALKLKELRGKFYAVKLNKLEAEGVTGENLNTEAGLLKAAHFFLDKGIKQVYFTLGAQGVFYANTKSRGKITLPPVQPVNTSGAGDAFTAAIVYSYLKGYDIDRAARFGAAAAILTLLVEETVNPEISEEKIKKKMEVLGL